MKLDLHSHTMYSYDGIETPESVIARAKAVGLDGIAITDHNTVKGVPRAVAAGKRLGIHVVMGKEIAIMDGKQRVGEILALFLENDTKKDIYKVSELERLLDEIKDQDAISSVPHPFDGFVRKQRIIPELEKKKLKTDAIEAINGRNAARMNAQAFEYALRNKRAQTAGSDAHILREVGHCYTFSEATDIESFRKAIRKKLSRAIGNQRSVSEIFYNRLIHRIRKPFRHKENRK